FGDFGTNDASRLASSVGISLNVGAAATTPAAALVRATVRNLRCSGASWLTNADIAMPVSNATEPNTPANVSINSTDMSVLDLHDSADKVATARLQTQCNENHAN